MNVAARLFNMVLFGGLLFVAVAITTSTRMLHGAAQSGGEDPAWVQRAMTLAGLVAVTGLLLEVLR